MSKTSNKLNPSLNTAIGNIGANSPKPLDQKYNGSAMYTLPQTVFQQSNPNSSDSAADTNTPPSQPHQNITFNNDGTVSIDGKTMSKNDYNSTLPTSNKAMSPEVTAMMQEQNQKQAEYNHQMDLYTKAMQLVSNSQASDMAKKMIRDRKISEMNGQNLNIPDSVNPQTNSYSVDALDLGKVAGGAITGATGGAAVAGPVGAVVGGLFGGAAALFFSQSGERKQDVLTGKKKFMAATQSFGQIQNSYNAGQISEQQAAIYWENAYQRVKASQMEIESAGSGLFGSKLSQNTDELAQIEGWLQNYQISKANFYANLAQGSDPSRISSNIGIYDTET